MPGLTAATEPAGAAPAARATTRLPARAAAWLACLAPFFFLTYGFANWLAAQRSVVPTLAFAWETQIPFLPWSIVPYWSIDAFYGLSLFVCATTLELDRHALRLLTAQLIAVACFIALPLQFGFVQPATDGLPGLLFAALGDFDKPFNQAPSLHITLLVILWVLYARRVPRRWHWLLHGWFALTGVSVLTTYQHHFVDVPTGALLGWFCVWLWPLQGDSPLAGARLCAAVRRRRIALLYAIGAAGLTALAVAAGGAWLWLLWPAVSGALVAAAYLALGASVFQKTPDGRMSAAARWLLAPQSLIAWVNSRVWTWRRPAPTHLADGVWIGRFPSARDIAAGGFTAVIDLCAELPAPATAAAWHSLPSLDLAPPKPATLRAAAQAIEQHRRGGPVLVTCALGYARSAAAVATWLLATGRAGDAAEAVAALRRARPWTVLGEAHRQAIAAAVTG
jgi:membrane-associated phospholipid phosphatase